MSALLPDLLDLWRAVDNSSLFTGRLPLSSLPRLQTLLLDTTGDVQYRLAFSRDEGRRAVVLCEVAATLKLCCQRCLEALDYQIGISISLAPATTIDEVRELPKRYEPLLMDDNPIRPRDLIEDELLLALPQIPMHEPDVCGASVPEAERIPLRQGKTSPFAPLAKLVRGG